MDKIRLFYSDVAQCIKGPVSTAENQVVTVRCLQRGSLIVLAAKNEINAWINAVHFDGQRFLVSHQLFEFVQLHRILPAW